MMIQCANYREDVHTLEKSVVHESRDVGTYNCLPPCWDTCECRGINNQRAVKGCTRSRKTSYLRENVIRAAMLPAMCWTMDVDENGKRLVEKISISNGR